MDLYTEPKSTSSRLSNCYNRPLPPLPKTAISAKRRCCSGMRVASPQLSHFPTSIPTLLPQEQVSPLSLQDNSFLYILSSVDQYPTAVLALLPKVWRKKLLSSLSPFRLYQMERTAVAKDIATEEIWEDLSNLKDCVWKNYLADTSTNITGINTPLGHLNGALQGIQHCESSRSLFINYLSHLLFNETNRDYACKRITELLHGIHIDKLEASVANMLMYGHINSLFMFRPPYYLIPFRCPNLTEREIYWSLYGNKMTPTSLELYVNNLDSSPLWNQDIISQEMMSRLFHKLSFIRLYNRSKKTQQLEQISSAVTHSNRYKEPASHMGSLKHLEILRTDDYHLSTITPHFSAPHGYSNLTSLKVSMRPVLYVNATKYLGNLVKHQLNSLQHLELQGIAGYLIKNKIQHCYSTLFTSLSDFIWNPRFRSLTLCNIKELPWTLLQQLLEASLRTVPSHDQTIVFKDISVTTKGERQLSEYETSEEGENQFYPASERQCLKHKRIHFQNVRIPAEVLDWLENMERLWLHTLEFSQVKIDGSLYGEYVNSIEITISGEGIGYGQHVTKKVTKLTEKDFKQKFLKHKNFECKVFVWDKIIVDSNCLLNV